MKVFVSNDISEKGVALLREHFDVDIMPNMEPAELIKVINNYDALVTRSLTRVTKEVIEASTRLKVIGRAGVGVDNIDIPAATAKGIVVLNTPEGNTMAATEHTVAMLMAMTRHIPQAHQSIQEGKWDRKSFTGIQVQGRTLGIIGVGRSEGSSASDDNARVPHSYEMPRNTIDLSVGKKWGSHWELKFNIRDLLAERVYYKQFANATYADVSHKTIDEISRCYKPGRNIGLQAIYKF